MQHVHIAASVRLKFINPHQLSPPASGRNATEPTSHTRALSVQVYKAA